MDTENLKSIRPAFVRVVSRTVMGAGVGITLVCTLATVGLLQLRATSAAAAQAHLCAAALTPGVNGDLSDSFHRLRSRYDRLVAVATLDPNGGIRTFYGDQPAYRAAVADTARQASATTCTTIDGERLWSVTVPLTGVPSPATLQAVFLLRRESDVGTWIILTVILAIVVFTALSVSNWNLQRWFARSVVRPLGWLGRPADSSAVSPDMLPLPETGWWSETDRIARKLDDLTQRAGQNEARERQIEHEAEQRFHRQLRRFDRRLRRAEDQATTDPLTGLRNRRFLEEELEPLFSKQQACKGDLAVVMIDIDNFKALNDTQGHDAGDGILQFLGELLRAAIRPTDHAVRYGGDEAVLLLPNVNVDQARNIAERIVKLFRQYVSRLSGASSLSLSAGVAALKAAPCVAGHELVTKADDALYEAKRLGKNTVTVSPSTPGSATG